MGEQPSEGPVGSVLILGAGVAGLRAADDLAVVGYEVLLTDESRETRALLSRLATIPASERCGLCRALPKQERRVATYFCMRKSLLAFSDRIELLSDETEVVAAAPGGFELRVAGRATRTVDAVIVAGTLEPEAGRETLEQLVEQLGAATSDEPAFEPVRTAVPGLFRCGPLAGATDLGEALTSASAAAGEASRYLQRQGRGFVSDIKRVDPAAGDGILRTIPVVRQALVVGGSLAGARAALSLAERGVEVQLLERGSTLGWLQPEEGGRQDGEAARAIAESIGAAVEQSDLVTIHRETDVLQASGTVGRFLTVVRGDRAEQQDGDMLLPHGATIIATGVTSPSGDRGPRYDNSELAKVFSVEQTPDGTLQEASSFKPVDFVKEGVYLARARPDVARSMIEGEAAAQRAYRYLSKDEITTARVVSRVSHAICSHCETCLSLCPYEARSVSEQDGEIVVNERVCEGCGVCVANCPSDASELVGAADEQTARLIDDTLEQMRRLLP